MAETTTVTIRPGELDEGARLKAIAIASKSFWGYEPERVRAWADQGDFTPDGLRKLAVFVAEVAGRAIAWASVEPKGEAAWLADLWVEPDWIGKGIGSRLFRQAAEHARAIGARALEWEAEPNSVGFYEKMGASHVRYGMSEWGRRLSVMRVDLDA